MKLFDDFRFYVCWSPRIIFHFFLFNYSFVQIIVWTFILLLIWNSKICFNYREIDINVLFGFQNEFLRLVLQILMKSNEDFGLVIVELWKLWNWFFCWTIKEINNYCSDLYEFEHFALKFSQSQMAGYFSWFWVLEFCAVDEGKFVITCLCLG